MNCLRTPVRLLWSALFAVTLFACAEQAAPDAPSPDRTRLSADVGETAQALHCPTSPFFPSCAAHCGFNSCSPASTPAQPICCSCDAGCVARGDCCCDYAEACSAAPPAAPSCDGHCGGASPDGCYCDALCSDYGDCCGDYEAVCAAASCAGHCGGGSPGGCYCDAACTGYGDCCGDYEAECVGRAVVQLAAGGRQTCARLDDGNVRCWGNGQYGVLGYGSTANVRVPASAPGDVPLGASAVQIATGYYHACALLAGGSVKCWGRNDSGQLGYPGHGNVGDDETPASMPAVAVGGTVTQLTAGIYHTCALLSGGSVTCWGDGWSGALGYGNTNTIGDDEHPSAVGAVPVGGSVATITAGGFQTCARLTSGSLRCWGANTSGQLGYGNNAGTMSYVGDNETPASVGNVPTGATVLQLDLEDSNMCAVFSGGSAKCWGSGSTYLGYGSTNDLGDNETVASLPALSLGGGVLSIGTGGSHHCALLSSGGVRCWGYVVAGGLGYASPSPIATPAAAGLVNLGGSATQLSVGYGHMCALLSGGGVRCWGMDGALGYAAPGAVGDDEVPASMGDVDIE